MVRRIALLYIALASPLILASFFLHGPVGEYLFVVLAMGFPVGLIVVAAVRNGRLGPLAFPLALLLLILEASGVAMLVLRGRVVDGPWLGGFPLAAAVQLYGLWLMPLLLVALAYGLTFDRFELREEDLQRLERESRNGEGA